MCVRVVESILLELGKRDWLLTIATQSNNGEACIGAGHRSTTHTATVRYRQHRKRRNDLNMHVF